MPDDLTPIYEDAGRQNGIDPDLIKSIHSVESRFNDMAVSPAGALGRGQFLPRTARSVGVSDPFDAKQAIYGTAKYLRELSGTIGDDFAVAGYHGGPNTQQWGPKTAQYVQRVGQDYQRRKATDPDDWIAPQSAKSADDWITPGQHPVDDWITPGQQEGRPLTNAEAVKQLPMAEKDEGTAPPQIPVGNGADLAKVLASPEAQAADIPQSQAPNEAAGRVAQSIKDAWQNSPTLLTPKAQEWLDKTGLGGVTRLADIAMAAPNAVFAGLSQTAVETARSIGGERMARGAGEITDWIGAGVPELAMGPHVHGEAMPAEAGKVPEAPGGPARLVPEPQATPQTLAQHSPTPTLDAVASEARARAQTPEQAALDELHEQSSGAPSTGSAVEALKQAAAEGEPKAEAAPAVVTQPTPQVEPASSAPEVAEPPDVRQRLAEVSAAEAEQSKAEERQPPPPRSPDGTLAVTSEKEAAAPVQRPEKLDTKAAWNQHQAWWQQQLGAAQQLADVGKPMRFADTRYPHLSYLISPEMHQGEGAPPGAWRVTTFSDGEPIGHEVHNNAFDAFKEATTRQWEPMAGSAPRPAAAPPEEAAKPAEPKPALPIMPSRGEPTPFEKLPREPMRLVEWLKQNGGIKDEGGDLKAILGGAKGRPGLINKNGATLDDAAHAAWQAGYLPDAARPDTNALLDAIREDHTAANGTGTKRYSQQDYDQVQDYHDAVARNDEVDRLATTHEIETKGKTRDQFYDELHDRLSTEARAKEIQDQEAGFLDAQRELDHGAREPEPEAGLAPSPRDFYGQSQARTLADLEREYADQSQASAAAAKQRGEGAERPAQAAPPEAGGQEANGPRGRAAGDAGRGSPVGAEAGGWFLVDKATSKPVGETFDPKKVAALNQEKYAAVPAAQYLADYNMRVKEAGGVEPAPTPWQPRTDLLGRQVAEPRAKAAPEPTIRNDPNQTLMPGTEASAVQAQAARDAQGRGALQTDRAQKPADEGLFAPDTSGQGTLYSFPGALFGPEAWKRLFREQPGYELLQDKQGISKVTGEIRAGFAPTSLRGAKPMEYAIRQRNAAVAQSQDQAFHALQQVRDAVDRLPREAQIDFTDRFEHGEKQPTEALQAVADSLRSTIDDWTKKIQALGKGYLAHPIENYAGHIWGNWREWSAKQEPLFSPAEMEQQARWAATGQKRPLTGSGNFLKKRSFPTQLEGIQAGLEPVTYNPVDLQLIKLNEMQKFYHGVKLADRIKDEGLAKWVPATQDAEAVARNEGWVKLDDKIFQPRLMGESNPAGYGRLEPGSYWSPEPLARVFNNYMSQGWNGNSIYSGVRRMNNALNGLQLFWPGFHATFVGVDTMTSKIALALQQAAGGHPIRAISSAAQLPIALPQALMRGSQLRKEWLVPGSTTPEVQGIVKALQAGGGRMSMPEFFKTSDSGAFFRTLSDLKHPASPLYQAAQMFRDAPGFSQKVMVPLRLAGRVMDQVMQPVMGYMVPRAKMGVFSDMAQNWLRDHPNASHEELSAAMTKIVDSIDNRLGQLNYDNLFWNKTMKDLAFITTRSVGWNLGTVREIGGGVADLGAALTGRGPKFTERMAYTMAMPIMTATIGAILTYLATGQGPQSMLDYFYPPTGGSDENGVQERRSIPGYMKDVIAFSKDPQQTVLNKMSPLLETANEVRQNKDYYGRMIYNPMRDRGMGQAYADYLLNQASPFTLRALQKQQSEGLTPTDQALALFGFQPAPKSITQPERQEGYHLKELERDMRRKPTSGQFHYFNAQPEG